MFAAGSKAAQPDLPVSDPDSLWKELVEPVRPLLERTSRDLVEQVKAFEHEISTFARYALTAHGKQLRPALLLLSGRSSGEVGSAHVTVAVIVELIHIATLVHDDVVDEADLRRRRPTVAANWGNEISVLLGDCLFAHALTLAASFPTPEICRAVAQTANTVCAGEIVQTLRRRNAAWSQADYFRVVRMKTAELFALSCELGAKLSGAPAAWQQALRRYGLAFGTAYQVYDDCLDLFGSENGAGKSLGTDLATGKITLPLLIVRDHATAAHRSELTELLSDWQPEMMPALRPLLMHYDALPQAQSVIADYTRQARQALADLPATASRASLDGLLEFLAQQTRQLGVTT